MHAFITIRLVYCNGLLYGLPKSQTVKLQRACVHNAAARLVLSLRKYSHITPQLCELHQLPIQYRIQYRIYFNILLLALKAIQDMRSSILKTKSTHNFRSNRSLLLDPSRGKMLVTPGNRSFSSAAPYILME